MPKVYHTDGERAGHRERVFVLDARISRGDYPSYAVLARHCGVSEKTIQRNLEYMRDIMYAPLEYDSTEKGWHYTDKTFSLPAQFGSKHDLQALLVLGEVISQYASTPLGESGVLFAGLVGIFLMIAPCCWNSTTISFARIVRP